MIAAAKASRQTRLLGLASNIKASPTHRPSLKSEMQELATE